MVNKIAIDWDADELRLVAAQCNGRNVKVTDASVIPVENGDIQKTLQAAIAERGLENTETLVAIGRGKAELRELQLPPVPDDELPDLVRFQAIRSFATAGDNATVDFLVTKRTENGIEMIAAAVGPSNLASILEMGETVGIPIKRIALRPLAASALYLINHPVKIEGDTVLIDLLADDAEIVVSRDGKVIFVRTVRMPGGEAARGRALASELKRSLVACGSSGSIGCVILWGRESVHSDEVQLLSESSGCPVEVVNPFDLVDVDRDVRLPEHVGRLAPLVGLLVADDSDGNRLVDFLNPRQRHVEVASPYRRALMIGVPVAAVLLLAFLAYRKVKGLDQQIADLKAANAAMQPDVDRAKESIAKTETIDEFLDGDVNWLKEIRRMAVTMPPSEEMIVRSVSVNANTRGGGGTLKVEGGVVNPSIIESFEQALRDESHQVKGDGASEQKTEDAYRWGFTEAITVTGSYVRNDRYAGILEATTPNEEAIGSEETAAEAETAVESESVAPASEDASNAEAESAAQPPPVDQELAAPAPIAEAESPGVENPQPQIIQPVDAQPVDAQPVDTQQEPETTVGEAAAEVQP